MNIKQIVILYQGNQKIYNFKLVYINNYYNNLKKNLIQDKQLKINQQKN